MEIYLRYSCCKCCWCCCPCSLSVAAAARKAPYDFIALVLQGYKWILPATTTTRRCFVSVRQSTRAKGYLQLVILLLFACGGGKSGSHRHAGRMVIVVIVKSIKCNYGDHDMQQLWHDTRRSGAWFGDFSRGGGSTSPPDMTCSCAVLVVDVVVALIIIIIAMERNPWKL